MSCTAPVQWQACVINDALCCLARCPWVPTGPGHLMPRSCPLGLIGGVHALAAGCPGMVEPAAVLGFRRARKPSLSHIPGIPLVDHQQFLLAGRAPNPQLHGARRVGPFAFLSTLSSCVFHPHPEKAGRRRGHVVSPTVSTVSHLDSTPLLIGTSNHTVKDFSLQRRQRRISHHARTCARALARTTERVGCAVLRRKRCSTARPEHGR